MEETTIKKTSIPYDDYTDNDISLLKPIHLINDFDSLKDNVELHIFESNELMDSNYDFKGYNIINKRNTTLFNNIELHPQKDLELYGFNYGSYNLIYNFYKNVLGSSQRNQFFIKEISPSRTEIILQHPTYTQQDLQQFYIDYIVNRNTQTIYSDFLLNFGENKTEVGVNMLFNISDSGIYIKLYEPLPNDYQTKQQLWISEPISDSIEFTIVNEFISSTSKTNTPILRGPNFNINVNERSKLSTPYVNISNIIDSNSVSSFNQIQTLLNTNVEINIDYNDYKNFIHFSSAQERLNNFIYKLGELENIDNSITTLNSVNPSLYSNDSIINLNNKKNNIIKNFDGFEQYMYFESGSNCFPKLNNVKPYINVDLSTPDALTWIGSDDETSQYYGGKILDSYNYDITNRDYLYNNLPTYILDDPQNHNIKLFVSMWGQHFDYLWSYIKDIPNKVQNDNRIDFGISKDLISETLKGFGINLYENSQIDEDIYMSLLGINSDGTYLPTTGSYVIDNYVTSSLYTTPSDDINKEIYKRIYHNLPYLLKSKGTNRGLRALINCFGIPSTILSAKEFGGIIKESNDVEKIQDKFNYSLNLSPNSIFAVPFVPSNNYLISHGINNMNPDSIEFRFKLNDLYTSHNILTSNNNTKLVRTTYISGTTSTIEFGINGSGGFIYTNPITIEFDEDTWYNVSISRATSSIIPSNDNEYSFTVGYNTPLGSVIESDNIVIGGGVNQSYNLGWNNSDRLIFSGDFQLQEVRLWVGKINPIDLENHINNPKSISNISESTPDSSLILRIPLGSELDNTYLSSISPINLIDESPFIPSSSITLTNYGPNSYTPNYETYYINSPNGGGQVENESKIKIIDHPHLPDNTLSPNVSIFKADIGQTKNQNTLEVGFSPTYNIDDDIISHLGNFNIDDYIGDPLHSSNDSYPDLDKLKLDYFKKYIKKQNITDIIKLAGYLNNSLFKIIKDFTPAKSDLSSGIIIKSPILEKNKAKKFEPSGELSKLNSNIDVAIISGDNPSNFQGINSSIKTTTNTQGEINTIIDDNREFYDGEFPNSNIIVYSLPQGNTVYERSRVVIESGSITDRLFLDIPLNPISSNVFNYKLSNKFFKIFYNNNINEPSNIGYITSSLLYNINNEIINSTIQESNYSSHAYMTPRYYGSKLISQEYNKYTEGDISYGKQPVINNNKIKFGYFKEISSQSFTLPGRSNVYLKYLIDENSNITELSKQNKNIFDIQSIFNVDEVDILLNDNQEQSNQSNLDGLSPVYAGGFSLNPILQNYSTEFTSDNFIEFIYKNEIEILNTTQSSGSIPLPNDSVILGNIIPNNPTVISPTALNVPNQSLFTTIQGNLKIPITRNTTYNGEIRLRITGSMSYKASISPQTNLTGILYSRSNQPGPFSLPQPLKNLTEMSVENSWPFNGWDNIRWVTIPTGTTGYFYNGGNSNVTSVVVGNGTKQQIPNYGTNNGVDLVRFVINGVQSRTTIHNLYNNLGNIPNVVGIDNVVSPVEEEDGVEAILKFPIEGMVIIPPNTNQGDIVIKSISGQDGNLKAQIRFTATTNNGRIQFTTRPSLYPEGIGTIGSPYYMSSPPEYLYVTGTLDYGYNSGSNSDQNWYFERENSISTGSYYNMLVGSYYLSNIIYENIATNNEIIQSSPISSSGYEQVNDILNIKVGDVVRLFNHDKNNFPINFENEVKNIIFPTTRPDPNNYNDRVILELVNEIPNQACLDYIESGENSYKIQNFILLSKKANENNIILNKNKFPGKTSSGVILPSNISNTLKEKAGNIIKQLKNEQLIN